MRQPHKGHGAPRRAGQISAGLTALRTIATTASRWLATLTLLSFATVHASAQETPSAAPHVEQAFALPTPPGATTGAVYLTLSITKGDTVLTGASTPMAATVELHSMQVTQERMQMHRIEQLAISSDAPLTMAPGSGPHLMLIGLTQPLTAGDKLPLTLHFLARPDTSLEVSIKDYAEMMSLSE
ncbi:MULTISPECIES: copper chaperone PCu(A)C [Cobetia]|uniref:copper chaperone PCu(A)C n=1 Tax=Cobetia TaxID=204286 RepID=UPI001582CC3A|nr:MULTISPECIES: copper chaperone PCu(A)C [Cobetia]MDI4659580.1 copper chaperone PCu(A)C [Cobetia sp. BMC6]MDL2192385.1 copper chaperone PCu(A)C [Cobetia sp. LC6]NUJ56129.1 copper chaperone PCu(A)C [Cobetia marina]